MSAFNGGGVDLSRHGQVIVTEERIIRPGDVQVEENGLGTPGCDSHLRVVHMASGVVWRVPLTRKMEDALVVQITDGQSARGE